MGLEFIEEDGVAVWKYKTLTIRSAIGPSENSLKSVRKEFREEQIEFGQILRPNMQLDCLAGVCIVEPTEVIFTRTIVNNLGAIQISCLDKMFCEELMKDAIKAFGLKIGEIPDSYVRDMQRGYVSLAVGRYNDMEISASRSKNPFKNVWGANMYAGFLEHFEEFTRENARKKAMEKFGVHY